MCNQEFTKDFIDMLHHQSIQYKLSGQHDYDNEYLMSIDVQDPYSEPECPNTANALQQDKVIIFVIDKAVQKIEEKKANKSIRKIVYMALVSLGYHRDDINAFLNRQFFRCSLGQPYTARAYEIVDEFVKMMNVKKFKIGGLK